MSSSLAFSRSGFRKMALLSGVMLLTLTMPALAGFEWKGPVVAPAPATSAKKDDSLNGLEPITWNGADGAMPMQKVPDVEMAPIEFESAPTATIAPAVQKRTTPVMIAEPGEVISGFGHDLPLIMALQQVAPEGYQFSFAPGVDAGQSVSWDGGRGWKAVLSDMLATKGLSYVQDGKTLNIRRGNAPVEKIDTPPSMQTLVVTPPVPENRIQPQITTPGGEPITIRRQKPIVPPPVTQADAPTPLTSASVQNTAVPTALPLPPAPLTPVVAPPVAAAPVVPTPVPAVAPEVAPIPAPVAEITPPPSAMPVAEALTAEERAPIPLSAPISVPPTPVPAKAPEPVAEAPKADIKPVHSGWQATRGETLRAVLNRWADDAGVNLYWSIDYDYKLSQDIDLKGNFEAAVQSLLDRFAKAKPQPYGQLHQNSQGPAVLVIKVYN